MQLLKVEFLKYFHNFSSDNYMYVVYYTQGVVL